MNQTKALKSFRAGCTLRCQAGIIPAARGTIRVTGHDAKRRRAAAVQDAGATGRC